MFFYCTVATHGVHELEYNDTSDGSVNWNTMTQVMTVYQKCVCLIMYSVLIADVQYG